MRHLSRWRNVAASLAMALILAGCTTGLHEPLYTPDRSLGQGTLPKRLRPSCEGEIR